MEAKEFPQFPAFDAKGLSTTSASTIREMIERTIFAVSTDETRYSLNGVYIEQSDGGKVRMVATDGHRLAFEEKTVGSLGLTKGVILPRKGLARAQKVIRKR